MVVPPDRISWQAWKIGERARRLGLVVGEQGRERREFSASGNGVTRWAREAGGGADGLDCRGAGIRVPRILRVWERDFGVVGLWSG